MADKDCLLAQRKRKVNDDYGIYYNLTHESKDDISSESSDEDLLVMSRVDWIITLRDIF
jgi:hypothetical protein